MGVTVVLDMISRWEVVRHFEKGLTNKPEKFSVDPNPDVFLMSAASLGPSSRPRSDHDDDDGAVRMGNKTDEEQEKR